MNTKQNAVQELKSERLQQELAVEGSPLVIELKSERVQAPANAAGGEKAMPSVVRLTVNQMKRVVVDVWWMGIAVTLEEPAAGTEQQGARPAQAA